MLLAPLLSQNVASRGSLRRPGIAFTPEMEEVDGQGFSQTSGVVCEVR